MPTYPTYKLEEVAEIILGQSPESKSYNTKGEGLPFFQGKTEFTDWSPIPNKWCTEPKKIAEPLDILLSVRAPVGPTNVAKERCCIGRGLAAIRYSDCYKYVLYYLRNVSKYLESKATGTTFAAISGDVIKNLPIPLPPLPTQRAIVARIETLFAELDNGVEKLKTAQQQLKVYRQAVLNDCLTKGSEKWEKVKLGDVTLKIGSGSTPKGGQTSYKVSGIPLVRSMNIYSDFIKYDGLAFIDESQAKLLDNVRVQEGDILLNITGASIGRVNIAPKEWNGARVNQHVCIIRMNSEYNSKFVQKYLASPMIQHWISTKNYGETRQALSKTMIENIEIPNPPLPEQQRIVQEIETRLSACDKVEKRIAESLQQAEALRQSILKKAFDGELV